MGLFFAGLGLPGLCGFIGEVLVVLSVWKFSPVLAILSASVVILTAAYILWAIQRVYLGPEYKGPHAEEIRPINNREFSIGAILLSLAILFGVFPNLVIRYMDDTVEAQVDSLNEWRVRYEASVEQDTATETEAADQPAEPVATASSADVVTTDIVQPLNSRIRNKAAVVVSVNE
jgi:NADH-quinone oxidoreductase subunit M